MSTSAIEQLVELLGHPLPSEYLRLLDHYPVVLINVPRAIDDSDSEGNIEDVELIRDLDSVLEINQEARTGSVPDPEGVEHFWPDQLLVIGETGEGDYYCLDVDEPKPCVMQFNHQSVIFEVVADDLQDFVQMLVEVMVEFDPDAPDEDFDLEDEDLEDDDSPKGDTSDGDTSDGDARDGIARDENTRDENTRDENTRDENTRDENTPNGDTQQGDSQGGSKTDGSRV